MKKCPYCAEEVLDDATKCKHCGEWLQGGGGSASASGRQQKTRTRSRVIAFVLNTIASGTGLIYGGWVGLGSTVAILYCLLIIALSFVVPSDKFMSALSVVSVINIAVSIIACIVVKRYETKSVPRGIIISFMVLQILSGFIASLLGPNFQAAKNTASSYGCMANLKQIHGAATVWAIDHNYDDNARPEWSDLIPEYIKQKPRCPSGGQYIIRRVGEPPACTVHGEIK